MKCTLSTVVWNKRKIVLAYPLHRLQIAVVYMNGKLQ